MHDFTVPYPYFTFSYVTGTGTRTLDLSHEACSALPLSHWRACASPRWTNKYPGCPARLCTKDFRRFFATLSRHKRFSRLFRRAYFTFSPTKSSRGFFAVFSPKPSGGWRSRGFYAWNYQRKGERRRRARERRREHNMSSTLCYFAYTHIVNSPHTLEIMKNDKM